MLTGTFGTFLILFNSGKAKRFVFPPAPGHELWEQLEPEPGKARKTVKPRGAVILRSQSVVGFYAVPATV